MNIQKIWNNIKLCEGETFKNIKGREYKYVVYSDFVLINDDVKCKITKNSFEKAMLIDNPSPSKIQAEGIWGPSYVYGIITDKRIRYI